MFKIGDKVRCIQDPGHTLVLGAIYVVEEAFTIPGVKDEPVLCIRVVEIPGIAWSATRFELCDKETRMKENQETVNFWDTVAE